MVVGLFIGRFQPFHHGHENIVLEMISECDEVIVVIGSSQYSHTADNPFTAGERYQMVLETIRSQLPLDLWSKIHIIPVEDIGRYGNWVHHIETMVPPFDKVYTGSPLVERLFKEAGYETKTPEVTKPNTYVGVYRITGSEVRRLMVNNDLDYRNMIPSGTREVIKRVDGVKRLIAITKEDK